jgi:hypothetical protein
MECPNSPRPKKRGRWRAKSWVCSSLSFTSRVLFINNSSLQSKQSIPHTTVTFYRNCVKMWANFAPNIGDKRSGCYITTTHRLTLPFFTRVFLTKNNMTFVPHPSYFSVCPIDHKTERPPFWHNWSDRGRIADGAEHPYRTRFPGCKSCLCGEPSLTRGRGLSPVSSI